MPEMSGSRYLAEAMQGYADDEDTALQAHFTNTAPAIADIDGDGQRDIVMLASVQNAAQSDRERGVAVWVVGHDGSRRPGFDPPVHLPDYLSGLWDYGDTNIVGITNQVAVADCGSMPPDTRKMKPLLLRKSKSPWNTARVVGMLTLMSPILRLARRKLR